MSNQGNLASLAAPAKRQGALHLSKKAQELIADCILTAVLLGFFVLALNFSPRAQFMPLVISGIAILCMALEIVVRFVLGKEQGLALDGAELFGTDKKKKEFKQASLAKAEERTQEKKEVKEEGGKESTILLWLLLLGAMLFVFGFQLTCFAYPVLFLKLGKTKVSWPIAVVIGALTWASIFVLFSWILNMPFFPGFLFGGEM
jgi:hypothetical protein